MKALWNVKRKCFPLGIEKSKAHRYFKVFFFFITFPISQNSWLSAHMPACAFVCLFAWVDKSVFVCGHMRGCVWAVKNLFVLTKAIQMFLGIERTLIFSFYDTHSILHFSNIFFQTFFPTICSSSK